MVNAVPAFAPTAVLLVPVVNESNAVSPKATLPVAVGWFPSNLIVPPSVTKSPAFVMPSVVVAPSTSKAPVTAKSPPTEASSVTVKSS